MSDSDKITYQDIVDSVAWLEANNQSGPYVRIMHPNQWAKEFKGEIPVVRDSDPST